MLINCYCLPPSIQQCQSFKALTAMGQQCSYIEKVHNKWLRCLSQPYSEVDIYLGKELLTAAKKMWSVKVIRLSF